MAPLLEMIKYSCVLPENFKIGKINVISKTWAKTRVEHYRPITLFSSLSKLFEKWVANRLINIFDRCKLFNQNQFEFKKGFSTPTALTKFLNTHYETLDKRNKCIGSFWLGKSYYFLRKIWYMKSSSSKFQ